MAAKILIVDDEEILAETIEMKLRSEGFAPFVAHSAEDGMHLFRQIRPDLVLLDIMLPRRSGFDFCKAVRKDSDSPIIFISARGQEGDRLMGLELGADDYLVKPLNLAEVVARIRAVLRRSKNTQMSSLVQVDNLTIDPETHLVNLDERTVELAAREFALLHFLARNRGRVFSRETILDRVWAEDAFVNPRTVDVHIRWLRQKIEIEPEKPKKILTVRGVGYKFA